MDMFCTIFDTPEALGSMWTAVPNGLLFLEYLKLYSQKRTELSLEFLREMNHFMDIFKIKFERKDVIQVIDATSSEVSRFILLAILKREEVRIKQQN